LSQRRHGRENGRHDTVTSRDPAIVRLPMKETHENEK
jgi:hypothetical protein